MRCCETMMCVCVCVCVCSGLMIFTREGGCHGVSGTTVVSLTLTNIHHNSISHNNLILLPQHAPSFHPSVCLSVSQPNLSYPCEGCKQVSLSLMPGKCPVEFPRSFVEINSLLNSKVENRFFVCLFRTCKVFRETPSCVLWCVCLNSTD